MSEPIEPIEPQEEEKKTLPEPLTETPPHHRGGTISR